NIDFRGTAFFHTRGNNKFSWKLPHRSAPCQRSSQPLTQKAASRCVRKALVALLRKESRVERPCVVTWLTGDGNVTREQSMPGTHHVWKVSLQTVMQDQRMVWLKLDCFKPSFLALTRRGVRMLIDTYTEDGCSDFL